MAAAELSSDSASELGRTLRLALGEELRALGGLGRLKRRLIVSATLTRVSSERGPEGARAAAAVSLALVHADDRVLCGELRGRASVEEPAANLASVRAAALRGAVRRALSRLPEAAQRFE